MDGHEPRRAAAKDLFVDTSEVPYAVVLNSPYRRAGRRSRLIHESFGGNRPFGDRDAVRFHNCLRRRAGKGQGICRAEAFCAVYEFAVYRTGVVVTDLRGALLFQWRSDAGLLYRLHVV